MDSSSDDDRIEEPLPMIPYRMVEGRYLMRYSPARRGRTCLCRERFSYHNHLVLQVVEERRQLTRDLRIARAKREEMEATMEAQAARIQELEARVLEERQRADASHARFQEIEGRLIRIVQEAGTTWMVLWLSV